MIEVLDELRLKDYIVLAGIVILIVVTSNLSYILDAVSPDVDTSEYTITSKAQIIEASPIYKKRETLAGTSPVKIGYDVRLSYEVSDEVIYTKANLLYSSTYPRVFLDSVMNSGDLDVLINEGDIEQFILKTT